MQRISKQQCKILIAVTLVTIVLLFAGYEYLRAQATWPIAQVTVVGDYKFIGKQVLEAQIAPWVAKGLLNARAADISGKLEAAYPSLAGVGVHFDSFHSMIVTLQRHTPVIVIANGEIYAKDGAFFTPKLPMNTNNVPHFDIDKAHIKVWLMRYKKWRRALSPFKLHITQVRDAAAGWQLQFNQSVWLTLGNVDVDQRFNRFVAAYPLLMDSAPPHKKMVNVDMRYQYGIAVRWV